MKKTVIVILICTSSAFTIVAGSTGTWLIHKKVAAFQVKIQRYKEIWKYSGWAKKKTLLFRFEGYSVLYMGSQCNHNGKLFALFQYAKNGFKWVMLFVRMRTHARVSHRYSSKQCGPSADTTYLAVESAVISHTLDWYSCLIRCIVATAYGRLAEAYDVR